MQSLFVALGVGKLLVVVNGMPISFFILILWVKIFGTWLYFGCISDSKTLAFVPMQ